MASSNNSTRRLVSADYDSSGGSSDDDEATAGSSATNSSVAQPMQANALAATPHEQHSITAKRKTATDAEALPATRFRRLAATNDTDTDTGADADDRLLAPAPPVMQLSLNRSPAPATAAFEDAPSAPVETATVSDVATWLTQTCKSCGQHRVIRKPGVWPVVIVCRDCFRRRERAVEFGLAPYCTRCGYSPRLLERQKSNGMCIKCGCRLPQPEGQDEAPNKRPKTLAPAPPAFSATTSPEEPSTSTSQLSSKDSRRAHTVPLLEPTDAVKFLTRAMVRRVSGVGTSAPATPASARSIAADATRTPTALAATLTPPTPPNAAPTAVEAAASSRQKTAVPAPVNAASTRRRSSAAPATVATAAAATTPQSPAHSSDAPTLLKRAASAENHLPESLVKPDAAGASKQSSLDWPRRKRSSAGISSSKDKRPSLPTTEARSGLSASVDNSTIKPPAAPTPSPATAPTLQLSLTRRGSTLTDAQRVACATIWSTRLDLLQQLQQRVKRQRAMHRKRAAASTMTNAAQLTFFTRAQLKKLYESGVLQDPMAAKATAAAASTSKSMPAGCKPSLVLNQAVFCHWNGQWYPAKVIKAERMRALLQYCGYDDEFNEWISKDTPRLIRLPDRDPAGEAVFIAQQDVAAEVVSKLERNPLLLTGPKFETVKARIFRQPFSSIVIEEVALRLQKALAAQSSKVIWAFCDGWPCWWPGLQCFLPVYPLESFYRKHPLPLAQLRIFGTLDSIIQRPDFLYKPYVENRDAFLAVGRHVPGFERAVAMADDAALKGLFCRSFGDEYGIERVDGHEMYWQRIAETGFRPTIVSNPAGLNMKMPTSAELPLREVVAKVGRDRLVPVIDVATQLELTDMMRLEDLANYFEGIETAPSDQQPATEHSESPPRRKRDRILNVLSMEVSSTPLAETIRIPKLVKDLDWTSNSWPSTLRRIDIYPHVQMYCLLSAQDSFTDFHIDFGGSSVFYHVIAGEKIFHIVEPTDLNLERYELFHLLPDPPGGQWPKGAFADMIPLEERTTFHLHAGETLFLPSGWIHAVVTPVDSIVIGGNFLHSLDMEMQARVHMMEMRTNTPLKFQFPFFSTANWYALDWYLERIAQGVTLYDCEITGLEALCAFTRSSLMDAAKATAADPFAPSVLPFPFEVCWDKVEILAKYLHAQVSLRAQRANSAGQAAQAANPSSTQPQYTAPVIQLDIPSVTSALPVTPPDVKLAPQPSSVPEPGRLASQTVTSSVATTVSGSVEQPARQLVVVLPANPATENEVNDDDNTSTSEKAAVSAVPSPTVTVPVEPMTPLPTSDAATVDIAAD